MHIKVMQVTGVILVHVSYDNSLQVRNTLLG